VIVYSGIGHGRKKSLAIVSFFAAFEKKEKKKGSRLFAMRQGKRGKLQAYLAGRREKETSIPPLSSKGLERRCGEKGKGDQHQAAAASRSRSR